MTNATILSPDTRRLELRKLIVYAEENKWNPTLIDDYKGQLAEVEEEIKKRKEYILRLRAERGINK